MFSSPPQLGLWRYRRCLSDLSSLRAMVALLLAFVRRSLTKLCSLEEVGAVVIFEEARLIHVMFKVRGTRVSPNFPCLCLYGSSG